MLGSDFIKYVEPLNEPGVSAMHKRNGSSNIGNYIGREGHRRV